MSKNYAPQSELKIGITLDKSQYSIVGNFNGEATVSRFLFFPIGLETNAGYLYGGSNGQPCFLEFALQVQNEWQCTMPSQILMVWIT